MTGRPGSFDPRARAAAKQASREQDEAELKSGEVSRDEMRKRNSFAKNVDFSRASVQPRPSRSKPDNG